VVLPHNAFLLVALTCMLNALRTGNRIILRAPQQSARSASILAAAIEKADPPPNAVSVVSAPAKEFLEALYHSENPCLIHYMGSSAHAPSILSKAFQNRKSVIIDGQGNGWIYVADDACIETAVRVLSQGAIRYNGQTCTSVNGAIIAPGIFPIIRDRLQVIWDNMSYGNPLVEDVQVGLLFDNVQAANCVELIQSSNGKILSGGHCIDNLLQPTLVESPEQDSLLVTEGVFGCVLWISPGTEEDFISCWNRNRYPLCAGIISDSSNSRRLQMSLGNLARLTVNGDPSNEYLFEPWGAYPGSGLNSVSLWSTKYQRVVQVDEPSAPPRKESNGLIH
jgi:glyceraldehyde-3-phosphate dehydrogenase [NAD(P)+]